MFFHEKCMPIPSLFQLITTGLLNYEYQLIIISILLTYKGYNKCPFRLCKLTR